MADRPILFSAPMVRALLAGTKTQTRRLIDFKGIDEVMDFVKVATDPQGRPVYEMKGSVGQHIAIPAGKHLQDYNWSPRIGVGDLLWVRENAAVRQTGWHHTDGPSHTVSYRADEDEYGRWLGLPSCGNGPRKGKAPSVFPSRSHNQNGSLRWQPSIHMPRWASRLTLTVTDVRIERLQDISEADAIAEGAKQYSSSTKLSRAFNPDWKGVYREGYAELWNSINGPGDWEANPWVVAYTFAVQHGNIDQIAKVAA
jgi:hypothetical protein